MNICYYAYINTDNVVLDMEQLIVLPLLIVRS